MDEIHCYMDAGFPVLVGVKEIDPGVFNLSVWSQSFPCQLDVTLGLDGRFVFYLYGNQLLAS